MLKGQPACAHVPHVKLCVRGFEFRDGCKLIVTIASKRDTAASRRKRHPARQSRA
jgi:hypothetical protein